jgi:DMSO reductase family type II enzyme chaperone
MTQLAPQTVVKKKQDFFLDQKNITPETTVDVIRSRIYYLLSLAFSFPDEKLQDMQTELWELMATLYPEMKINKNLIKDVSSDAMEAEYINVFDGHEQKKYCRPYEGLWKDADRAKQQWEVKKFYQFFGLGLNKKINEMPDHIMYELEFMHYLNYRMIEISNSESTACKESKISQPENYLQAQKDFLERHLSTWTGKFCQLLQEKTDIPFYNQLAKVTVKFIEDDVQWIHEQINVANKISS